MNRKFLWMIVVSSIVGGVCAAAAEETPPLAQDVVRKMDAAMNPSDPFRQSLDLVEYVDGRARNEIKLAVLAKLQSRDGAFKNLVRWEDPPRDRGKAVLMNGTAMWFYDPASKTSLRISPQQRLVGQASEGDVVTINLAYDYRAEFVGAPGGETVADADKVGRECWRIELKPVHDDAIYGRAEYWVEKTSFHPVKAKFYADSGRLLKIAYYHRFEKALGVERPGETILLDAVNAKLVTTMGASGYRPTEIPDSWFQREYLPRLTSQ